MIFCKESILCEMDSFFYLMMRFFSCDALVVYDTILKVLGTRASHICG